jgi:hypothetical protein
MATWGSQTWGFNQWNDLDNVSYTLTGQDLFFISSRCNYIWRN